MFNSGIAKLEGFRGQGESNGERQSGESGHFTQELIGCLNAK